MLYTIGTAIKEKLVTVDPSYLDLYERLRNNE